ncbi:ubiquinol-cytochrome c reductase iron-sulfur subunit [Sneathiella chungangensis]|uniref:Ubiquinol-cytochrome c reductase iron-sulfur subunit n=1 Tax=Sneathiella chungangensis TaxID=1418234 RepID=A0A845MFZ2_9PROT|nr:ubiquinol-cytochrome c reductase iron-sulfur subunit [Sneathiella chungangensis]MZR22585.1 ubiquinol-cytochrome c reductase iron-sulfur subunit [Sneathiella chungangensis]
MTTTTPEEENGVKRRDFLYIAAGGLGAVGTAAAIWPFISQMNPSADVLALSTTEADLEGIEVGSEVTVVWQGKPVFVRHRTEEDIQRAEDVDLAELRDPQPDADRVIKPEWLIMVGICTHLGCVPLKGQGEYGGWFCPCHGSHYDTSGRIRKGPAPLNLAIPPYEFLDDNNIKIG